MIGWMIIVSSQTPEERDAEDLEARREAVLAQWEVGPGGIDWIEDLARAGKAEKRHGSGYPNRYVARAGEILPLLSDGPPAHTGPAIFGDDYVLPPNWKGNFRSDPERMAACPADRLLTIDAWDLS